MALTLPSFHRDPAVALSVAVAADEAANIDAIFAYDHLFRVGADGSRRPSLECFALLSAVAMNTKRVAIGSLVTRATLRAPGTLAASFATLRRLAGDRVIAGIGAGDHESLVEHAAFGIAFDALAERLAALHESVVHGLLSSH